YRAPLGTDSHLFLGPVRREAAVTVVEAKCGGERPRWLAGGEAADGRGPRAVPEPAGRNDGAEGREEIDVGRSEIRRAMHDDPVPGHLPESGGIVRDDAELDRNRLRTPVRMRPQEVVEPGAGGQRHEDERRRRREAERRELTRHAAAAAAHGIDI